MLGAISQSVYADQGEAAINNPVTVNARAGKATESRVKGKVWIGFLRSLFGSSPRRKNYNIPSSVLAAEEAEKVARAAERASKAVSAASVNAKANAASRKQAARAAGEAPSAADMAGSGEHTGRDGSSVNDKSVEKIRTVSAGRLPVNPEGVVLKEKTEEYEIYKVVY